MAHVKHQIRDAVLSAVTGLSTTKRNAFASRVHPVTEKELPCVLVFTREETSTPITMGPNRRIARELEVLVEGYVKNADGYDEKLDKISKEVEAAIYNTPSLQSLIRDIFLSSTEIKLTGEGDKAVAAISMNFTAKYHTRENDPETFI